MHFDENLIDDTTNLSDILQIDFEFDMIQKAINRLDTLSRDIIHMKFIEEKSNQEISELLDISNDNIRQKLSRAVKALKEIIKNS